MFDITFLATDNAGYDLLYKELTESNFASTLRANGVTARAIIEDITTAPVTYDAVVLSGDCYGTLVGSMAGRAADAFDPKLYPEIQRIIRKDWCGELPVGHAIRIESLTDLADQVIYVPTHRTRGGIRPTDDGVYNAALAAMRYIHGYNEGDERVHQRIETILIPAFVDDFETFGRDNVIRQMQLGIMRFVRAQKKNPPVTIPEYWDRMVRVGI